MLTGKRIISAEQEALLRAFARLRDSKRFHLTGGTALAEFYFGHRRSYDLDVFTSEPGLITPFSREMETSFRDSGLSVRPLRRFNSFAEFLCSVDGREVRIQLAYDSPYRFEAPVQSEYGVLVNSYPDIVVDKLLAFFGRWTHRDAVDLFFILERENSEELFARAKEKDPGFDLYWLAVALKQVEGFPDSIAEWDVTMISAFDVPRAKNRLLTLSERIMNDLVGCGPG